MGTKIKFKKMVLEYLGYGYHVRGHDLLTYFCPNYHVFEFKDYFFYSAVSHYAINLIAITTFIVYSICFQVKY